MVLEGFKIYLREEIGSTGQRKKDLDTLESSILYVNPIKRVAGILVAYATYTNK